MKNIVTTLILLFMVSCDIAEINKNERLRVDVNNEISKERIGKVYNQSQIGKINNQNAILTPSDVYTIEAPNDLSATYSVFVDTLLYITYHKRGDEFSGHLDVFDIKNGIIKSQVSTPDMDWNSVEFDNVNDKLVFVGETRGKGAVIFTLDVEDNFIVNNQGIIDLPGGSANGVTVLSNSYYTTTTDGIYEVRASDLSLQNNVEIENLKYIVEGDGRLYTLQVGENSNLIVLLQNLNVQNTVSLLPIIDRPSKNTLSFYDQKVYFSMGERGIGIYDIRGNGNLDSLNIGTYVNSISVNDDNVFVSSDDRFIFLDDDLDEVFQYRSFDGSANHVHAFEYDDDDYISLSIGQSGTIITTLNELSPKLLPNDGTKSFTPTDKDIFYINPVENMDVLFTLYDVNGDSVGSMGTWVDASKNNYFYVPGTESVKGEYSAPPFVETTTIENGVPPTYNETPNQSDITLTSRYDQNGKHIFSLDYSGGDMAIVRVHSGSMVFELVLHPNSRTYFYANDTTTIIRTLTGSNLTTKATNNNTWGGI